MPIVDRGSNPAKPFILDYYDHDGNRHQIPFATRLAARVHVLAEGGPKSAKDKREATVGELFEHVWTARQAKRRPGQVERSRQQAALHLIADIEDKQVRHVNKADLAKILSDMQATLSEATVGNLVTYFVTNFDVALHHGCIRRNLARIAFEKVSRAGTRHKPIEPLPADVETLHETANGWPLVQLALYTEAGLSPPEAAALPWSGVDLEARTVHIANRTFRHMVVPLSGDRLARKVPMTERLFKVLAAWRLNAESGARLVLHPDGSMRNWTTLGLPLAQLQIELGMHAPPWKPVPAWCEVDGQGPRYDQVDFRLTAIGSWHREGKSLKEIAALLGLKSTKSLVALIGGLADEQDLAFIGIADSALGEFLAPRSNPN